MGGEFLRGVVFFKGAGGQSRRRGGQRRHANDIRRNAHAAITNINKSTNKHTQHHSEKVIIATKVSGPGNLPWIRGGPPSLDAAGIGRALDASLQRLSTDSVDLLQLHWPDRWVPMFGARDYDPSSASYASCPLEEQLEALEKAVREGKARSVGLSNETAWGVARCGALAEFSSASSPLPRVASVQNAYSLLCRTPEVAGGVLEACDRERVGLLAYAPLAAGHLTGKYMSGPQGAPPEARLNKYRGRYAEAEMRYAFDKPGLMGAVRSYVDLAREIGITPAALALRFVLSRPRALVPAAVVGATGGGQLRELLDAAGGGDGRGGNGHERPGGDVGLSAEVLERIDAIHERHPNPLP
jgi:aryl-alcohol dehydrogenase-like predicted oxidoreductase